MAKTLFTKIIIAILLLSLMLPLAVSCGESETTTSKPAGTNDPSGTDDPTQTTGTPAETTTPKTTQPKVDYPVQLEGIRDDMEDSVVQFIYVEGEEGIYTAKSLWVDEETVTELDAVDQQTIDRNNRIHEDIGVTIEPITDPTLGISGLYTFAKTYFDVQDPGVDVYCGFQYYDLKVALTGCIMNLNTIVNENQETLIDITQPYWATDYINSITYNDLLFWVTGDLSLRYTGGLYCTFVNLDLYDQYVRNNYDGKSIYEIVNEKKWTMQTMIDMADMADFDFNSDGKLSSDERIGLLWRTGDILDGIPFGCKIGYSTRSTTNGKDTIAIALPTDERGSKLAGYIASFFSAHYAYRADFDTMLPIFAQGNALFTIDKLYRSSIDLYAMERFAIIPTPLLDGSQDDYGSGTHDGLTIFGISKYSNCPKAAAATLELMAYYGYLLVTPTYIESVLKGSETIHDPDSIVMIDKIRAGFDSDFAAAWTERIGEITYMFRGENVLSYSSMIKTKTRIWTTNLKRLLEELDAVGAQQ
ncbi:MAG: hypothetical protein IKM34_03000 [Clostridia bacterium]|nr:hypothetical protein [Clostridia bacterium]